MKHHELARFVTALICLLIAASAGAQANKVPVPHKVVRVIHTNAEAVQTDAKIRQWTRVSGQVARIVESERALQKELASEPAQEELAGRLKQSVRALRSAVFVRDAKRTIQAAQQVAVVCEALNKNLK